MEDEKLAGLVARMENQNEQLARTQANEAIAQAVLRLLGDGRVLTLDSLVEALEQEAGQRQSPLLRIRNQAAAAALRAASPRTPS